MHYKVGTRGSKLALTQTGNVIRTLEQAYPNDTFEAVVIRTAGDLNQTSPIPEVGKGIFVEEIQQAMLEDRIQIAVHSMKDMPAESPAGLTFCRSWQREDPRDVLILREAACLTALPTGARVGTGSLRRGLQLQAMRPDLQIVPIRGNIDTRLCKLHDPELGLEAIVLAAAGLHRLGLQPEKVQYLSPDEMIPAPAQGILAIQLRADNAELLDKLNCLSDAATQEAAIVEREYLDRIGGDCHLPIAAYCEVGEKESRLLAMFGTEDGSRLATVCVTDTDRTKLAAEAVRQIRQQLEA